MNLCFYLPERAKNEAGLVVSHFESNQGYGVWTIEWRMEWGGGKGGWGKLDPELTKKSDKTAQDDFWRSSGTSVSTLFWS
jgi:hypothetical protein